jgi:hypothetical protein
MNIRFKFVRIRNRKHRGPRILYSIDTTKMQPAQECIARMVLMAMSERDGCYIARGKAARLGMRISALWARVFAGHIKCDDPRLEAAMEERETRRAMAA